MEQPYFIAALFFGCTNLLAKNLREGERAGDSLEGLLHRSNPWSGTDCAREKCLLCETKKSHPRIENQNCKKRNVVYETWFETCRKEDEGKQEEGSKDEIKMYKYIWESAWSCHAHGWEHLGDCEQLKPGSQMLKHIQDKHAGMQPGEIQ